MTNKADFDAVAEPRQLMISFGSGGRHDIHAHGG